VNTRAEVKPDVIIRRTELGYDVEIVGAEPFTLCVNPAYRNLFQQLAKSRNNEERKQIQDYVERAELFIRNINRRRQTLKLITKCIIEHQAGFLETGSRQFLHTLTRTRVAQLLEMHESIVSRATANKFVQLPHQEVVSFDLFFDASLSVKDAIDQIIRSEDPSNPYSDKQIAELLGEMGIQVARRTIVKYRDSQKILSSARRRQ
jgi:RNA polymerase sigma-54 factor